jgi:antitoxin component YwqK of YwqJK toxin-antitoxin module
MRTVLGTYFQPWTAPVEVVDTTDNESDTLSALEHFYIRNFSNNMHTVYYENGHSKTSVEMDGNTMDGVYLDYYENGVIKTKGRYRNGVKNGTWRYYKPDGSFDYKEKYIHGELKKQNFFEKLFGGGKEGTEP